MHPRRYETLLLTDPELSEEQQEQLSQKLADIMEKMGGRPIRTDTWGRRRLAYPVHKQIYGTYTLMDFMGSPEMLAELERNLRIDERVWKYMSQLMDKMFSEEKYNREIERLNMEKAKREQERADREAERARREAERSEAAEALASRSDKPAPAAADSDLEPAPAAADSDLEPAPAAADSDLEPAPVAADSDLEPALTAEAVDSDDEAGTREEGDSTEAEQEVEEAKA